jgi:CO/xanthine dehydrogenase FAD-binding subunit
VADGAAYRLAVGGVVAEPLSVRLAAGDDLEAALNAALEGAEVLSDWQGSSEYRRAMALVLSRRALDEAVG